MMWLRFSFLAGRVGRRTFSTALEETFETISPKLGSPSPWASLEVTEEPAADKLNRLETSLLDTNTPNADEILHEYEHYLKDRTHSHFGYPYNLNFEYSALAPFLKYSINNLGDPYVTSNYGIHSRPFEKAVIEFFAKLFELDNPWGYVTTSGTEGNLHGMLCAREALPPDAVLYTSAETHYSIFKAARYYRIDCVSIPTLPMGEIDYDLLERSIDTSKPVIMNVNIGTTVKGAVDNLDKILKILEKLPREQYYVHCDGALFAMMLPFLQDTLTFKKNIDSIAVSGHKMLGSPMPCGITLTRREHVDNLEEHIDYLNSVDTTIMGSRNGQAALYLWYNLKRKGMSGLLNDVKECMETAKYLKERLREEGFRCQLNNLSTTVVLERPKDEAVVQRWQLACEQDICHVVVMPNVTREKIDQFVMDLQNCRDRVGSMEPLRADSPLTKLSTKW